MTPNPLLALKLVLCLLGACVDLVTMWAAP